MKTSIIAFFFAAFFAGASFAQDQIQNQPAELQGWYKQNSGDTRPFNISYSKNRDSSWTNQHFTTNGGNTWLPYPPNVTVLGFIGNFGYAISPVANSWIAITNDGGQTWNNYNTGLDALNYYFVTPSRGFCAVGNSYIGRTLDGGKTWTVVTDPIGQINGFTSWDSLHILAGGGPYPSPDPPHNVIASTYYSSDGGNTWIFKTDARLGMTTFQPILAFDTAIVWLIGGLDGIYKSYNRSQVIVPQSIKFGAAALAASDSNNITGVGNDGDIYRTFDAGKNWVKQNSGTINRLFGVSFVDSTTGWAVGDGGVILHTTNAGYSWVRQTIQFDTLNIQTNPNPANSNLTVGFTLPVPQHVSISILDMSGQVILTPATNLMESEGIQFLPVDTHTLASGVYMLRIQTERYDSAIKITVVH